MYDTALGLTTQSKLTVQAPGFGERGSSFGDSILLKNTPTAIIYPTPVSILSGSRLRRYSPQETIVLETIVPKAPAVCYAIHGAPCTRHVLCRRPQAMDGQVSPEPEDTVFARISLLSGRREGTVCTAPYQGSLERKFASLLT